MFRGGLVYSNVSNYTRLWATIRSVNIDEVQHRSISMGGSLCSEAGEAKCL